jgi:protocatechuate 3,4-dioxygenase beta subunit
MNPLALRTFSSVLLSLCTFVFAQPQTKPVKKEPVGSISGKVTINGKGAPGIVVGTRLDDRFNRYTSFYGQTAVNKTTTDEEGNYQITNLPPGTYQVMPADLSFVVSGDPEGRSLIIAAGETVEGIDFTLIRGGVITGRVTDSDGRPVIAEEINLLTVDAKRARPSTVPQMNQTDDRGVYRIFGIPQGKYKVAVGQSNDGSRIGGPRTSPYAQTFHPAETDASKATIVEVSAGSEATNVDIIVGRTVATFTASGRVVDGETGRPLANMKLAMEMFDRENGARSSFSSDTLASDNQGEFKVEHLTPGNYAVVIVPQENSEMRADPVSFDLIDQDVAGLLLKTSRGASVTGVVLLEGTNDKAVVARFRQLRIHVFVRKEGPGNSWARPLTIGPDGSFRVGGLESGNGYFSLSSIDGPPPRGFMVKRVERDGLAQLGGLEIKDGEQLTDVKLVVAYGSGTIRGVVTMENGEIPTAAQFRVWVTNIGQGTVDSRGRFVVEGLPSGSYEVNAVVYIPGSRNPPPRAKQQVNVVDGTTTEITITLRLNPTNEPAFPRN